MTLTDETENTKSAENIEQAVETSSVSEAIEAAEPKEHKEPPEFASTMKRVMTRFLTVTSDKASAMWSVIFEKTSALGEYLFRAFMAVVRVLTGSVLWIISRILLGWDWLRGHLKRFAKRVGEMIYAPISRYIKALQMGKSEISKARDKGGSGKAIAARAKVAGRVVFGKRGIAVTIANWALPIVSCVFLFNIVGYANNQTYALKLTVNGSFMGYIEDENVFRDASQIVGKRINYSGSHTEAITLESGVEVESVGYSSTLNVNQLADKMLELLMGADNIKEGYGLYIGDAFYGTLDSPDATQAALDEVLSNYRTGNDGESVEFDKDISYVSGLYLTESFVDENDIIEMLTSYKQVAKYYTVVEGDAYITISQKTGMTMEELDHLNPGFEKMNLHGGDQIKIVEEEPFLNVKITRPETYTESIPYESDYYEDSTLYERNKGIITKGVQGVRTVEANVSYINGVEVGRTITSRTVTQEPVTEVVAIGTKPRPSTDTAPETTIGAGQMLWPVGGDGGLISEVTAAHGGYYGHKGIDIVTSAWTPIYAAHNGYVLETGCDSSRGNYVRIQGDDGFVTHYYHMVEYPSCSYGQRVTAGDVIGYVGATGSASAIHLHFEVRYGGIPQYPVDYLDTTGRFASWCNHY